MIINKKLNKVINNTDSESEALLDLTGDTVAPENLLLNKTAHNRDGEGILGTMNEGGTSDYDELQNRPSINSHILTGNKTGSQLGLQNRVLASALNIGGQTIGSVEGALSALNTSKSDLVNGKVPVNELPVYTPVIGSIQSIGGIVPPSSSGDEDKYLRSDGTWAKPAGGGGGVTDYDDLTNRPKVNGTTLSGDKTGTQLGLQNIILSSTLSIGGQTVTEVEEALESLADISKPMTGATSSAAGEGGFVPSPSAGDENKALFGDGTWKPVSGGGGGHTILDEDGTIYPQRSKLQFEGCEVTDDGTNDITKIKAEGVVTGVKGNAESTYRTGNVNISPADIGLGNVDNTSDADKPVSTATQTALNGKVSTDGASTNTTVAFTSNDLAANTTAKTSNTTNQPSTVVKLESGETLASMFGKISSMFASIRKLWNTVGFETAQISKVVGDTSVTFSNNAIKTTSELTLLSENSSNTPIFYTAVTVSNGSATYTFPALTVATKFSLKVR